MRRLLLFAVLFAACGQASGHMDAGLDAGARLGDAANAIDDAGSANPCAPRILSIEEHCGPGLCLLDPTSVCRAASVWFIATWQRGCGYVQQVTRGDVGDIWVSVWDEGSGTLVFSSFNGRVSAGCAPPYSAGLIPVCSTWGDAC